MWDSWKDKATGTRLETYTIITTDPNKLMASIHNRMPVILALRDYERWLEPALPSHLPADHGASATLRLRGGRANHEHGPPGRRTVYHFSAIYIFPKKAPIRMFREKEPADVGIQNQTIL